MLTKQGIEKYFIAEKQESLLFIIIGVAAVIIAAACYFYFRTQWHKGFAIPLLVIGAIQIVVGYTVYTRSDKQRVDIVYAFDMNPSKLQQQELPRMEKVNKNFILYRWIEISLLAIAVIIFFYARNDTSLQMLYGIAFGLIIQCAVMITADYFAEQRADIYTTEMKAFLHSLSR